MIKKDVVRRAKYLKKYLIISLLLWIVSMLVFTIGIYSHIVLGVYYFVGTALAMLSMLLWIISIGYLIFYIRKIFGYKSTGNNILYD